MKADSSCAAAARLQASTLVNIYTQLTGETASMEECQCHPDIHNDVCVCLHAPGLELNLVFAVIQKLQDCFVVVAF